MSAQSVCDDNRNLEPSLLAELRQVMPTCLPGWKLCLLEDGKTARRSAMPAPAGIVSWCDLWVWFSMIAEVGETGSVTRRAVLGVAESQGHIGVEAAAQLWVRRI